MDENEGKSFIHDADYQTLISDMVMRVIPIVNTTKPDLEKLQSVLANLSQNLTSQTNPQWLMPLLKLLYVTTGTTACNIYKFLLSTFKILDFPLIFTKGILAARDKQIVSLFLDELQVLAKENLFRIDDEFIKWLSEESTGNKSILRNKENLIRLFKLVEYYSIEDSHFIGSPVIYLYLNAKQMSVKLFAALLLDSNEIALTDKIAQKVIGSEFYLKIEKYLNYTRATHHDLLYIKSSAEKYSPVVLSILETEDLCGEELTKEILSNFGWEKINHGFKVSKLIETSLPGDLPVYLPEKENMFLCRTLPLVPGNEIYTVIARSGQLIDDDTIVESESPVERFRNYNLTHADLLRDILDIAPLDVKKIRRILKNMEYIVDSFVLLFSKFSNECEVLPGLFLGLNEKINDLMKLENEETIYSRELTRLVQMFEDPKSLAEVTTIHGLKRYLHQQGLKLGFKLVERGQAPNRSIDIAVIKGNKAVTILRNIHFADFEPAGSNEEIDEDLPYPVQIVVNGFLSQMLYEQETYPRVNIFCYANEIHYYPWFRNHPVFIRIDFSPPLQGGMIDLEYFGVSNYELDSHPNLELNAIKKFFRALEFDVQLEGTRIHARYDKEMTVDFGLLCEKAAMLFRLVPYMMDLDFIIGSLQYDNETKVQIIDAWVDSFLIWGALPVKELLTKDNLKISCKTFDEFNVSRIVEWTGEGEYQDSFSNIKKYPVINDLNNVFDELGIEFSRVKEYKGIRQIGQLFLETRFLRILREAIQNGEIKSSGDTYISAHPELFKRIHSTELFAELLSVNPGELKQSAILAKLVMPLERSLTFNTIGNIEHLEVQVTNIPLLGDRIHLSVLRCNSGIIRLAVFSIGNGFYKFRKFLSDSWQHNWKTDAKELARILRQNNYVIPFNKPSASELNENIEMIINELKSGSEFLIDKHYPGQKIIEGLQASPGKASGKALLGLASRQPEDFDGAILIADSITPRDNTFLYHSSGIVSTGGGILSHAGLIAIQFKKPSMVIKGEWIKKTGGGKNLLYTQLEYKEVHKNIAGYNLLLRTEQYEIQYELSDGDIVLLDASKGKMLVLGKERDALALYEGLKTYGEVCNTISSSSESSEYLNLRGKLLKAQYHIEQVLSRIKDHVLARYAVYEIMLGSLLTRPQTAYKAKINFLKILIENKHVGETARDYLKVIVKELYQKYTHDFDNILKRISKSILLNEIICLRLEALKLHEMEISINKFLIDAGFEEGKTALRSVDDLEKLSIARLRNLLDIIEEKLRLDVLTKADILTSQHNLRTMHRISELVPISIEAASFISSCRRKYKKAVNKKITSNNSKYILTAMDGGIELLPLMGGKACNLAEMNKLLPAENVSPWFAVTDKAFQDVMDFKLGAGKSFVKEIPQDASTIRDAIEIILKKENLTDTEKSTNIRLLWESINLPEKLLIEITNAYKTLIGEYNNEVNYFAVRSSSLEEDTEIAARAGEFETFLFVKGLDEIVGHIKKAWAGLWTERAIHNRKILGRNFEYRGGIIVQKIVWARVSGVIQTINVAKGELKEIVINAGLGLGEGIVSGVVTADQITVSKENFMLGRGLNFNYDTADKKERVVFDKICGSGTILTETLYHQRFRAALEYTEIYDLVKIASDLEQQYGYPLDIEFAIEGSKIFIMQVRPVATFLAAFNETVNKYQFSEIDHLLLSD